MGLLQSNNYTFKTILRRGGPLLPEFEKLSSEVAVYIKQKQLKKQVKDLINWKNFNIKRLLKNVDLVISNTITNGEVLDEIRKVSEIKIISYVHELEYWVSDNPSAYLAAAHSDCFAVPCITVKDFLTNTFKVPAAKIHPLNYFLPESGTSLGSATTDFKEQNGLTAKFIIGGAGTVDWRKGTDIFLQVANLFFEKYSDVDVQFVWAGAKIPSEGMKQMNYDIKKLSLQEKFKVIESLNDMKPFYERIDLFLLTSREDSFPLVILEAASHKKPSICFDASGGAKEFVEKGAGTVIEYLNISKMADTVYVYYLNKDKLLAEGERAKKNVQSGYQSDALIMAQFNKLLHY